jgi:PAS domain S-box-containing protein
MPKILLVDDEPSIRFTMSEFLKREGYATVAAEDYDAALASFDAAEEIDAAVVDIILPRKGGVSLLEELHRRAPDLPVVMMTGEPNISVLPEIVRAGAYDFLTKPVTKDVLLKSVARAVEKKRLSDEAARLERELVRHAEELEAAVAARTSELVEARNFLKAVVDSPTEYALVVIDIEGRVTLFNRGAESMFRHAATDVLGQRASELFGEEADFTRASLTQKGARAATETARNEVEELKSREVEETSSREMEIVARRADGTRFVSSLCVTPVRDAGGRTLGQLAIVKDLTAERERAAELQRMQERLAQNEKIAALGRMAAQVAHEVRNPLTGLRLYAMHLRGKIIDRLSADEAALCEKILQNIDHLSNTTEQILNVARPLSLNMQPRRIEPLVGDVLQLLDSQLKSSRVEVKLDFDEAAPPVMLDEPSIRSALVNLLLNAIQSMPTGGALSVSTRAQGDWLVLLITDTGSGMTQEQLAQVFEPFYTTKSRGLGLGMPYAKRVVEQHRGSIRLESKPSEGTRVEIRLPLTEERGDAV